MASEDPDSGCMYSGCLCCYAACNLKEPLCCCMGATDFLCLRQSTCLAVNSKSLGCGMTTDEERGEICKIGCICCDCGLISPTNCCAYAGQVCCIYEAGSLPCSPDYVPETVCAVCFLQLAPNVGCCVPPPECVALKKIKTGGGASEAPEQAEMEDRK